MNLIEADQQGWFEQILTKGYRSKARRSSGRLSKTSLSGPKEKVRLIA